MSVRYGVFLRPDPRTCLAVTTITTQLQAQFGLVSAGAFPPHATLAGSLPADGAALITAVGAALADVAPFPVENAGVGWLGPGIVYDIHQLGAEPNQPLLELMDRVARTVRPLLTPVPDGEFAADVHEPADWRGHLSLASHDLIERADLRAEVRDYIIGLDVAVPAGFSAEVVALYRIEHPSWSGPWWHGLRWEHVTSWRLGP